MTDIGTSAFYYGTDVPKERVTLATPTITTDHAYIHEGIAYGLSGTFAANGTNKAVIAFNPPADTKATVTIDMTNANADMTYTAKLSGADGNLITVVHVNPGAASQPLVVTEDGKIITISLATGSNSAISSTSAQVAAAVNAASALVAATAEGTGAGIVNAVSSTALAGGKAAVYVHFKTSDFTAAADIVTLRILENATYTGTAATFTPINKNRVLKTASKVAMTGTLAASVTTTSAVVIDTLVARGTTAGAARHSSTKSQAEEFVMDPGTAYLLEFTPKGATAIDYEIFWYEESGA